MYIYRKAKRVGRIKLFLWTALGRRIWPGKKEDSLGVCPFIQFIFSVVDMYYFIPKNFFKRKNRKKRHSQASLLTKLDKSSNLSNASLLNELKI